MKTLKKCTWNFLLIAGMFCLLSCEREGPEYVDELDVVATRHDKNVDFSTVKTYVMPDSVVYIPEKEEYTDSDKEFDEAVLQRVEQNLESLGYERVDESQNGTIQPDVVITLILIERNTTAVYSWGTDPWYDWWGWYDWGYWGYPWIGPGWSPYYPVSWGSYSYTTGTLIVDMLQPMEQEEREINVLWNGVFNGIQTLGLSDRMLMGVDQMFDQSPYLSQ